MLQKSIVCVCVFVLFLLLFTFGRRVLESISTRSIPSYDGIASPWHRQCAAALLVPMRFRYDAPRAVLNLERGTQRIALVATWHQVDVKSSLMKAKSEGRFMIVCDGEPNSVPPGADLVLTTKKEVCREIQDAYYVPSYVFQMTEYGLSQTALTKPTDVASLSDKSFCVFAYYNCHEEFEGVRRRREFYELLQHASGGRVENLGVCCSKKGQVPKGSHPHNHKEFSKYKFVIAFESAKHSGYVSEKMTNALISGSVPIYWGADDVVEHFNPQRFVNLSTFASAAECVSHVLMLDANEEKYMDMVRQPILTPQQDARLPETFSYQTGSLLHRIREDLKKRNPGILQSFKEGRIV
jgi:hypothetical protein